MKPSSEIVMFSFHSSSSWCRTCSELYSAPVPRSKGQRSR